MISLAVLSNIIEKPGNVFSIEFIDKQGKKITISNCVCTSSHFMPRTYNIKQLNSEEIRKIRHVSITKYNGQETYY